jgi:tetratricopeptide (TPR) repeat protein
MISFRGGVAMSSPTKFFPPSRLRANNLSKCTGLRRFRLIGDFRRRAESLAVLGLCLLVLSGLLSGVTASIAAQSARDVSPLEPGKPVEREMAAGESHYYRCALVAGQYARLTLDRKSADLVLIVSRPDGEKITEAKGGSPQEPLGVVLVAKVSGAHRLEVRSLAKAGAPARYTLSIAELRAATDEDHSRVAAAKVYTEAMRLLEQGTAQSLREAIEKYQAAIPLFRAIGERKGEAAMLDYIGYAYQKLNQHAEAIQSYLQALQLYQALGDRRGEAATLYSLGQSYNSLGEKQKALDHFNQALLAIRALGDRSLEANALDRIARVYDSSGDKRKALDFFHQALEVYRALSDGRGQAVTLHFIAAAHYSLNESAKALDFYTQALAAYRALGDRKSEAQVLSSMGTVYSSGNENQKAIEFHQQALALYRATGDRRGEASALNRLGNNHDSLDEYQKALDIFHQSLALVRELNDRRGEAAVLSGIGRVYSSLGDYDLATSYLDQSLQLYRAAGDRSSEASVLHNLGAAYISSGEYQKALNFFNQALSLRRAAGDRRGEASTLNGIAAAHTGLNEHQKALEFYHQALAIARATGNRRGEAAALNNIGRTYFSLSEHQKALDFHQQALVLIRTVNDRRSEAQMLYNVARAQRALGHLAEARSHAEQAIRLAESLRHGVLSQELRASFFASVRSFFDLQIDLLMQLDKERPAEGFALGALEASERARARSLLELLVEARADIREGVEAVLLERERSLGRLLDAKAERQTQLLSAKHTPEEAAAAARELETLLAEYREVQARIRDTSPRYAALTQPQTVSPKEIQQRMLDRDSLLLEYALGDERSYLWAVSPDSITSHELPKRAEIEAAAKRSYELAKTDSKAAEANSAAVALSQMLLAPVAARLEAKRLVVVADGVLHYVPFAALPVPETGGRGDGGKKFFSPRRPVAPSPRRLQAPDR